MTRQRLHPRLHPFRFSLLAALVFAGLHAAASPAPAAEPAPAGPPEKRTERFPVYDAPITLSPYGLLFVEVVVNGRPARALVDTGSFRGIELSSRLAAEIGIALTETGKVAKRHEGSDLRLQEGRVASIAIGGMKLRDVDVSVVEGDVERISERVETPFDAILGWSFLARYSVMIDYRERTFRWSEGALAGLEPRRGGRVTTIPYETVKGVPVVAGFVGADSLRLLVDTGAPTCNLDPAVAKAPAGELVPQPLRLGEDRTTVSFRVKDLGVIRESLGCAAVLGNNLFAAGRLGFRRDERTISIASP